MRRHRPAQLVLVAVLVLAASGCSGLPTSSGVRAGQAIDNHAAPTVGNIEYPGPVAGADQKQIVGGFLDATAGTNQDYARAREYLTTAASDAWQPDSVVVTSGTRDLTMTGSGAVTATEPADALLDTTAHLSEQPSGTLESAHFGLVRVDGQWRISKLPNGFGLWMNVQQFKRIYQPQEIYYPAANGHTLVPDTQWYTQTGLVSSLAAAVVHGPPAWMDGMTMAGLPKGSELTGSSVSIDNNGVASVNVSSKVLSASPAQRTALWASMLATLGQVGEVRRVIVLVDGARLQSTDLPAAPVSPSDVGYTAVSGNSGQLVSRTSATQLQWVDPDDAGTDLRGASRTKTQPNLPVINRNWYRLALSADGSQLAGIDGANSTLGRWVGGRLSKISGFGTGLVAPSFSSTRTGGGAPLDELWVAGQSIPKDSGGRTASTVWVLDADIPVSEAQPQPIDAPWLKGMRIKAVRVSPDGDRVAIAVQDANGGSRVYVAGIVRDRKGHAQSLTSPLRVAPTITDVLDVGWVDYVTLVVLSRTGQNPVQPIDVPIGGLSSSLGDAPGGQQVVATGGGTSSLYVETDNQTVLTKVGATWQRVPGVTEIVASGT